MMPVVWLFIVVLVTGSREIVTVCVLGYAIENKQIIYMITML